MYEAARCCTHIWNVLLRISYRCSFLPPPPRQPTHIYLNYWRPKEKFNLKALFYFKFCPSEFSYISSNSPSASSSSAYTRTSHRAHVKINIAPRIFLRGTEKYRWTSIAHTTQHATSSSQCGDCHSMDWGYRHIYTICTTLYI